MNIFTRWLTTLLVAAVVLLPGSAVPAYSGPAQRSPANGTALRLLGGGGLPLLYQFSGVADDGAKGVNGKKATAITCSNTSDTPITVMEIVYGPNALASAYSVQFSLPAWTTYTASTQPTAMYAAPNYLYLFQASLNGTPAISQGMGRVFSSSASLICTAQVLDPSGYPPVYVTRLTLHNASGMIARKVQHTFIPLISLNR